MTIAIIGASGFIGTELTQYLLKTTKYKLVLFSHRASKLRFTADQEKRLKHIDGSVLNQQDISDALIGCDKAVYLVHLMGNGRKFEDDEQRAADNFANAANEHSIARVVYVGGMGDASTRAGHLQSRHQTGEIIRKYGASVIELHTPMVIGDGGAGFELLKRMVMLSPLLPQPSWSKSITNPITVRDVARYAAAALSLKTTHHESLAIGGPDRLSYADIAKRYAASRNRRLYVVPAPFVTPGMAAWIFRRLKQPTVADMIGSAEHSTEGHLDRAERLFPDIKTEPIESGF